MSNIAGPFRRAEHLDKPGIVGARWWNDALAKSDPVARRTALKVLLAVGGVAAGIAAIAAIDDCSPDTTTEPRSSLEMQKQYGWNFGAIAETLTFDGVSTRPFDRASLAKMADDLAPSNPSLRRFYVPTLFQSPTAMPKAQPEGDPGAVTPLSTVLSPIFSASMEVAYRRGRALASLFEAGRGADVAVVVDLVGPEAVAFAAGAAGAFQIVFGFDNWPHPRGVVPAHQTLAAAAYFQPLFARKAAAPDAPPMFVLDRQRLEPYTDQANQFDNRHLAKLPSAVDLKALGIKHVLYVTPLDSDAVELDDLNDAFVAYDRASLGVRRVGATAFGPDPSGPLSLVPPGGHVDAGAKDAGSTVAAPAPTMPNGAPPLDGPQWFYGSSVDTHGWFWIDYPWAAPPPSAKHAPSMTNTGKSYKPTPRATPFSAGTGGSATPPPGFATTPVVIAVGTGIILGSLISRSGSWNRSSGGWGG